MCGPKITTGGRSARFGRASYGASSARSRMRQRMDVGCVYFRFALAAAVAISWGNQAAAQQSNSAAPHVVTASDYQRAEKFMAYNTRPLVFHDVRAKWLPGDRFWYRDAGPEGFEFVEFDAAHGTHKPAFDHAKLAAALSAAAGASYKANHLPFTTFEFSSDEKSISFQVKTQHWNCDLQADRCTAQGKPAKGETAPPEELSPDGKHAAFIREYNLWVRDVASGKETQLTRDGVKDFGYATDNAGWQQSDSAILVWSPDSKKIATFQQDQRKDGEMYLVPVTNGHPVLKAWKYPLVGDADVTMIERVIIDVDKRKVIRLKMPPDQHRSTLCDDVSCEKTKTWDDVQWSPDGKHLAFVSTSRDHKQEWMRIADASNGKVRDVMGETVSTFFESGNGKVNWKYLPQSNELLWFSEDRKSTRLN